MTIAAKHGIKPIFVLFYSVWDPDPQVGKQRAPRPGVHNSGWVQSPSRKALQDASEYPRLEAYVKGVVGALARDERVVHNVGMINWGLVQGKSQTHLPWDSWQRPYVDRERFHEVFRMDGKPYISEEVEFIKRLTGKSKAD